MKGPCDHKVPTPGEEQRGKAVSPEKHGRDSRLHDAHAQGPHHSHDGENLGKGRLLLVIVFNLFISLAEIVGGILSGSLSLVSDAIHNLSDTASLVLSYVSIRVAERPKNKSKTYGYNRANILAAFVNASALVGVSVYLFVEAALRFIHPEPVLGGVVTVVAVIGLLGNLFSVLVLKKSKENSLNIRSSYLHLMGDTLSSVAVVAGGLVIRATSAYWIDPLLTILINAIILRTVYKVLRESVDILMQGAPQGVDAEEVRGRLMALDGVRDVHHLHIWKLDEHHTILEAHVLVDDMLLSETKPISSEIYAVLRERFGIEHAVIQIENERCALGECCL